jgi:uncharacterized protein
MSSAAEKVPDLQVEPGSAFDAGSGNGVEVSFAEHDEVFALHLYLVAVVGREEHAVPDFGRTYDRADSDYFGPHETLRHLRRGRNEDAAGGAPFAVILRKFHEDAVIQHLDGEFAVGHRPRTVPCKPMLTETVLPQTIDGLTLRGELCVPTERWGAVVVCHPHPLYGGDMDNPVVTAVCRVAQVAGLATVRFDFRGVRDSEGTHDQGVSERLDVAAALNEAAPYAEDGPLVLIGYSFGALVSLGVVDSRIDGWVLIAPPLASPASLDRSAATDHRPKLVLGPAHDQFTPAEQWHDATAAWRNTLVEVVPMADHFLAGRNAVVADAAIAFCQARRS